MTQTRPLRPSEALALHRDEVRAIIARYPVSNPRIFGSAARGEDRIGSDLDILVHAEGGLSYFDLSRLSRELKELLGVSIDIREDANLRPHTEGSVPQEAKPLL